VPTYEYRCQSCGHEMENFQSIKADPLSDCPECNTASLKRLISLGGGMIFRGEGFYETDYKRKDAKHGTVPAESTNSSASSEACNSCPHKAKAANG
jgi:putative FmdB family regulatory protein